MIGNSLYCLCAFLPSVFVSFFTFISDRYPSYITFKYLFTQHMDHVLHSTASMYSIPPEHRWKETHN